MSSEGRTLISLLRELPAVFLELVQAEFEQIKREMVRKLKNIGVGSALAAIAIGLMTFLAGTLVTAAVLGLAEVMPGWAAALVVSGILLVIIVALLGTAVMLFRKASPPLPTESFDSIVQDAQAMKGQGAPYDF
jgi:high-affinity Fe2+/Pb2+ permease